MASDNKTKTETWNSGLGAVLAVAGSAVGFGNFLRFPGLAAQYGGGAFMIAYFTAFLLLGIPLCWVEWTIGRRGGVRGGHSCASAFMLISHSHVWKYLGVLGVMAPLCIGMYYLYLEGWTLGYAWHTAVGDLNLETGEQFGAFFGDFVGAGGHGTAYDCSRSTMALFFGAALLVNFYLLYRGVTKGIEWFCKWSMPVLLTTAVIVMLRVLTLNTPDPAYPERNVNEGLGYMWNTSKTILVVEDKTVQMIPASATAEQKAELISRTQRAYPAAEVKEEHISLLQGLLNPDLWLTAAGQIFYSLSIGFGTVLAYASYVAKRKDIALCSLTANAANEVVEVGIAGMMIVPASVALLGVAAAAGAGTFGLGFNVLPQVFANMPMGQFFGTLFFGLLGLAAIASSMSIVQPSIAFMEEFWSLTRTQSVVIVGVFVFVGAGIVSWFTGDGLIALSTLDFWAGNLLLYVISALYLILFRFVWGTENGLRELGRGAQMPLPRGLGFVINWITPTILLLIFGSWLYKNIFVETCAEIQNLMELKVGAVLPLAWLGFVTLFMCFVVHTSRRFHRAETISDEQPERIPFS